MALKAVDIAKALGISKATVSLALNNRPGVGSATKNKILAYKRSHEKSFETRAVASEHQVIKLVLFSKNYRIITGDEIDMWSDVNACYDSLAKEFGYVLEVVFFTVGRDRVLDLYKLCNADNVCGVIVGGAELDKSDRQLLEPIKKPLVIYDADLGDDLCSVQLDNFNSAFKAAEYLFSQGYSNILYLARDMDIYNYEQRRLGFECFCANHASNAKGQILKQGQSIPELCEALSAVLKAPKRPQAILAESFHGSLATLNMCAKLNLNIPFDLFLLGIDDIPEYMTGGVHFPTVSMPHRQRPYWVMQMLRLEMGASLTEVKPKVLVPSTLKFND